jgi:hypothetical protein
MLHIWSLASSKCQMFIFHLEGRFGATFRSTTYETKWWSYLTPSPLIVYYIKLHDWCHWRLLGMYTLSNLAMIRSFPDLWLSHKYLKLPSIFFGFVIPNTTFNASQDNLSLSEINLLQLDDLFITYYTTLKSSQNN